MLIPSRIFLIGPMGAGKTTVGAQLATALNYAFVDSDAYIMRQTGKSVAEIFAVDGEATFRKLEHACIQTQAQQSNLVFAAGGGSILNQRNMQIMQQAGLVCYLKVGLTQQLARLDKDHTRPLLPAEPTQRHAALTNLQNVRKHLYPLGADIIICTDNLDSPGVLAELLHNIRVSTCA
jgi:shikimate kinase